MRATAGAGTRSALLLINPPLWHIPQPCNTGVTGLRMGQLTSIPGLFSFPFNSSTMTAPELLRRSDAHLPPTLRTERYARMRADVLGFFRGSAGVFYHRTGREPLLHQGPVGWLCGDLHAANFGTYKADNGLVYFDLNDFDEACLGPVLFDVVRLLVSVLLLAEHGGQDPAAQRRCAQELLSQYTAALATGKAGYLERDTARGLIKQLLRQVAARSTRAQLKERTCYHATRLRPGPGTPLLPREERSTLLAHLEAWCRAQPARPVGRLLDATHRVAGVGSLGTRRYLVLAEHAQPGKHPVLLDLKAARPSALAPFIALPQPAWASQAQRVVEVQRRLQAVAPALLTAVPLLDHSFVLRVLQPSADKFAFTPHPTRRLLATLPVLARLTAWAQLRSTGRQGSASADELMAFAHAPAWQHALLDLAQSAQQQVWADYRAFCAADL